MKDFITEVTILGSGTSAGVPVIACDCAICTSDDPKNQRTRCSIFLKTKMGRQYIVDTSPELRLQAIAAKIKRLDGMFLTHTHADHLHGFDDLRAFFFKEKKTIPCYGAKQHLDELRQKFDYAFMETSYPGVKPQVTLEILDQEAATQIAGLDIETFKLPHGPVETTGYRFGNFAFFTDWKEVSDEQVARLRGKVKTMVASGIHFGTHPTHSTVPTTVELFERVGVERGFITHLSHKINYLEDQAKLPKGVTFAFDGMKITL